MMPRDVTFQQFAGPKRSVNQLFIHPSGTQAVLIDGDDIDGARLAEALCYDWIQSTLDPTREFDATELLLLLHELLSSHGFRVSAAVVTEDNREFKMKWVGDYFALEVLEIPRRVNNIVARSVTPPELLGEGLTPRIESAVFQSTGNNGFILSGPKLSRNRLARSGLTLQSVRRRDLQNRLSDAATDPGWSALVFPVGSMIELVDPNWPYDPFVGKQEERPRERAGLRKIASALFQTSDFHGFQILEAPQLTIAETQSSRLVDGLLLSPFGVFLLELKDHFGEVEIQLGISGEGSMVLRNSNQPAQRNPVTVMRDALRPFYSDYRPILEQVLGRGYQARCMGLIVFTNDNVRVRLIDTVGSRIPIPYGIGEVIICRPGNIAHAIKLYGVNRVRCITDDQIEELTSRLVATPGTRANAQPSLDFTIDFDRALESESSDYFKVFPASHSGDVVWAKQYKPWNMTGVPQDEEFAHIAREVGVLQQLNRHRIQGIQYVYQYESTVDSVYVFVEPAYPMTLEDWIRSDPPRHSRLKVLRSILEILEFIGHLREPVVHRAVNPRNIRVGEGNDTQLINFELCQRESLATLPVNVRRTFDTMYQAPEVSEHGRQLTPAADLFSFMLCVHFALAGELPFDTSVSELTVAAQRRNYWPSKVKQLGLPDNCAELWQRALHPNASYRPSISDVKSAMATWS